jgi:ankyrin repeat protein
MEQPTPGSYDSEVVETAVSGVRQALYRGDRAAAEALVEAGAALNIFDAAALGDVEQLRHILLGDASLVREWSADGFTALHFAAYLGGAGAVEVLLEAGSDVHAVARNEMQVQPLHSGAAPGDLEACRLLLDAGADPNAAQHGGWTPLDEAVITKNEELAELLRDRGGSLSGNPLPS